MENILKNTDLIKFIESQKLLSLATIDDTNHPWISNLYYSSDKNLNLYYISPEINNHSNHIKRNNEVSFSIAWYDTNDLYNRKSIQGKGIVSKVTNLKEIANALVIHLKKYPEFKEFLNLKDIKNKVITSRIYKITPKYMKYWDDELYGEEGVIEY